MHILAIVGTEETEAAVACSLSGARLAHAETGAQGVDLAVRRAFDIILLDPRLPDMSGPAVLGRLRGGAVKAPVLVVSGEAGVADMSRGFGFGADGYVTTPVHGDELVDAIYHTIGRHPDPGSIIEIGGLRIDTALRSIRIDGERVRTLAGKEYQILELLARRRGEVVTKLDMLEHLYGGMDGPETKIIDVFVSRMRKILRSAGGQRRDYIETIWGRGYTLREPEPDLG
jgi:two-component system cell cycle response regulator CtrA